MRSVLDLGLGKMSVFGGPEDHGVGPHEGLALLFDTDLNVWPYAPLFLAQQPTGTTGLARRLNPRAHYIALRWDEVLKPHGLDYIAAAGGRDPFVTVLIRGCVVRVTNPLNNRTAFGQPADYGPGDGRVIDGKTDLDTGRLADLSPGMAAFLGVQTDDEVHCELILPRVEP